MKKIIIVIAVVAIAGTAAFAIFGGNNSSTDEGQAGSSSNQTNSSQSSQTASATDKVSISNFAFSPADITVKKGTRVTWTNNDSVVHTVTADSGTGPASENLSNGQTYNFTYDSVGTFTYHCSIHPEMHGTVTVTE